METHMLQDSENLHDLVRLAQTSQEPVVVFDGEDECLIAMRPAVFERILFDGDLLNCTKRETMRL